MRYVIRSIVQNRIISEREFHVPDGTHEHEVIEREQARIRAVYPQAQCYVAQRLNDSDERLSC